MRLLVLTLSLLLLSIKSSLSQTTYSKQDSLALLNHPRVLAILVVEADSTISKITAKIDRCIGCSKQFKQHLKEEAIATVKKSKNWYPQMQNGRLLRVQYIIPFELHPEQEMKQDSTIHK